MIPALLPKSLKMYALGIILGVIFDDFGIIFGAWLWKNKKTTKIDEKIELPTPLGGHLGAKMAQLGAKMAPRWSYVGQLGAQDGDVEAVWASS